MKDILGGSHSQCDRSKEWISIDQHWYLNGIQLNNYGKLITIRKSLAINVCVDFNESIFGNCCM